MKTNIEIFLDTNFIMDLLVREDENTVIATKIMEEGRRKNLKFHINFLSVANFAYITRKQPVDLLYTNLDYICMLFKIESNNEDQIKKAMRIQSKDFEDSLQYVTALEAGCDCIITRNKKDFSFSNIPVYSPKDFLDYLSL